MYTSYRWFSVGIGYVSSQQQLNDLRGMVTNLGSEITSQYEMNRMLMEKYKRLEEFN